MENEREARRRSSRVTRVRKRQSREFGANLIIIRVSHRCRWLNVGPEANQSQEGRRESSVGGPYLSSLSAALGARILFFLWEAERARIEPP